MSEIRRLCSKWLCTNHSVKDFHQMNTFVQGTIRDFIMPLIDSLESNHEKLLRLMRSCPFDEVSLTLQVLNMFIENSRPISSLVSLVEQLVVERDFDPPFLISIMIKMNKVRIRHAF